MKLFTCSVLGSTLLVCADTASEAAMVATRNSLDDYVEADFTEVKLDRPRIILHADPL